MQDYVVRPRFRPWQDHSLARVGWIQAAHASARDWRRPLEIPTKLDPTLPAKSAILAWLSETRVLRGES